MRARFVGAITLLLVFAGVFPLFHAIPGRAQTAAAKKQHAVAQTAAVTKPHEVQIHFEDFKLKNGLRVILSEDHAAPTYSICVVYNVGSRDEQPGHTGFAHLFEHMMFQGSQNVGKGEHFILVYNNGGNMNGNTTWDRTDYFETLPANQLDLGLYLESDRMRSLAVTPANFENQRNAVQEERRLRTDNTPYGKTFEVLFDTAYSSFGYKHPIVGSMEDLKAATPEEAQQFFKEYYAPNNAVLALVGDFQAAAARARIEKYFGDIPAHERPATPPVNEPKQTAPREKTIEDAFAQLPRLDMVFKTVPGHTADFCAIDMLSDIMAGGESSRLYQRLVKQEQVAVAAQGGLFGMRGPSMALFVAIVRPGVDPAKVESMILEELAKVRTHPVEDWELQKIKMTNRRQRAEMLRSTLQRATQLAEDTVFYNDPGYVNTIMENYDKVTKADIERVAKTYFEPAERTVVVTMPQKKQAPGK